MNTSLVNETGRSSEEIQSIVSSMMNTNVKKAEPLSGGSNSRVYRVQTDDGKNYAVKVYFNSGHDKRDRLSAEYNGLFFLWSGGIKNVPRPVAINSEKQIAVYGFIEGAPIDTKELSKKNIDEVISFLVTINKLRTHANAGQLPAASEAYFSPNHVFQNLLFRLNKLYEVNQDREGRGELRSFLMSGIKPYLNIAREWSQRNLTKAHIFFDKEIPAGHRILSPSDFGFHNAVRGRDGQLHFVDFEYFGWDDPAKTACDFILHPAMDLNEDLKAYFIDQFAAAFKENEKLLTRIEYLYPLFGIKWSLIMLNEFIPEALSRRAHASGKGDMDVEQTLNEQLVKSRNMLRSVKNVYQKFPYKRTEVCKG